MPRVDDATAAAYREALAAWMKQLEHVWRVFLEDEPITPDRLKGLLNREVRAKEEFEQARQRLLGLEDTAEVAPGENPFR